MKRPNLPYLEIKTVKGRTYIYFRKGKFRERLPDDPDTEEFALKYWAIRNGKSKRIVKTTWEALIVSYYSSAEFKELGDDTKKNYRRHCEDIREKNGSKDVRHFKRADALRVRDELKDTWSKANERIAVLSILLQRAMDLEWVDRNPVANIRKLKGGSYKAWPAATLEAYEQHCEDHGLSVARTIYELAIGTGQRLGDCVAMKWDDFDGEYMSVVQQKTGAKIDVYCPARLQAYLAGLPRRGKHILAKNATEPLGKRQVQKAVENVREAIGVKDGDDRLVPHGWRYTAAKEMADAGVDIRDIQSVTGHKTLEMAQKYASGADQKKASKRAQQKREQNSDKPGKCETNCETSPVSRGQTKENPENDQ
ncbi:tyrosine-type recombinase/integrase [Celeribacter sp. HF31]|uniref:site-specific integrase n=1 Tax=Celeribacter sp. HF31 TaxID=2721558 RepID=UPI0014307C07|nr:tyrosine-type recombinase/integrase [Celeribacter sp. HF31]NIY78997.1 tyrosine-type recombinase/integrase [Celeribacter sp. HF31]